MNIHGIMRHRKSGVKAHVKVAGYTEPEDLPVAETIIRAAYPEARAVLFLVPKPERKL